MITEDAFPAKIKEFYERNPGSSIVVKADARLTYGDVKKVMISIKEAGFQQVGLIAEAKDKPKGS
jgi:biopolymer transport protein ExbD